MLQHVAPLRETDFRASKGRHMQCPLLCASWHHPAPLPAAAELSPRKPSCFASGHAPVSAQALESPPVHTADATELNRGCLNLGFLIEAFGCAAGAVVPKNRQPRLEVQQNNSWLSGMMPAASGIMWNQTEPRGRFRQTQREWCDGVRFSPL